MIHPTRDLSLEALGLPESLDEAEEDVAAAWATEIKRRVSAARAGDLDSTDWRVVLDRVEREVFKR